MLPFPVMFEILYSFIAEFALNFGSPEISWG